MDAHLAKKKVAASLDNTPENFSELHEEANFFN